MNTPLAPAQILIVDDEPELRAIVAEYLTREGLAVCQAEHATAAREAVAAAVPQVAILDIRMPGEDGLSLARWLRAQHPALGIIMLTTAAEAMDRIIGLEVGADDYLPKPFELRELLARVRALLRRMTQLTAAPTVLEGSPTPSKRIRFGRCWLLIDEHRLLDEDGIEIPITAAEFELLALFARHPNRPLNRDQIMGQAHNRGWDVFDRSIDLRIMRLRRKVEHNPDRPQVLKTVRNVGYVFVPEPGSK